MSNSYSDNSDALSVSAGSFKGDKFYLDRRVSKEIFEKIRALGLQHQTERRKVQRLRGKSKKAREARCEFFRNYLEELDKILIEAYNMPEIGSNTKLKALFEHYGLCLTNGVCYYDKLKKTLKEYPHLVMPKNFVKKNFEKVKVLLIQVYRWDQWKLSFVEITKKQV